MGWVPNSKGGVNYSYVMSDSDHTLPNSSETVPTCIVVCTQPQYNAHTASGIKPLGGWKRVFHSNTAWKVLNARVQLVRYYAASSARIALGIDLPFLESPIPAPGLEYSGTAPKEFDARRYSLFGTESGTKDDPYTQEVRPEMEIEIWMGYLSKFDEVGKYVSLTYEVNPVKFTKVFTGVIDTVDLKLGRGDSPADGVNCIITARDRMRFLIDTKIFGGITIPGQDFTTGVDRTKIVQTLITQGSNGACTPASELLFHPSGRPPMKLFGGATGVTKEHTGALANGASPYALLDQFPVDAIRWFSSIETVPRELYCDPNTGNIAWSCRLRGEPYKRTKDASLFGGGVGIKSAGAASYNLDGLARAIKLYNNYVGTETYAPITGFKTSNKIDEKTAYEWASKIIQLSQQARSPKFLDPITFAAQIQLESQWLHYKDGEVNTSNAGAVGLAQVMPNAKSGLTGVDVSLLKSNPLYNLEMGWQVMVNKARAKYFNGQSIEDLYNAGKLSTENALMFTLTLYVGAGNIVPGTKKPQFIYVVEQELRSNPGKLSFDTIISSSIITNTETKRYANNIRARRSSAVYPPTKELLWLPLYNGWLAAEKSRTTGTDASTVTTVAITEDISVLRGEDNPWILSYKKVGTEISSGDPKRDPFELVRSKDRRAPITWGDPTRDPFEPVTNKIKPNVLSAHSSWSTLGMVTRFTLVTPQHNNSAGGKAKISASQSLFGTPTISGITYEQAMALTNDATSYGAATASTSAAAKKESAFAEPPVPSESTIDITNPGLLGPTTAQPLKFVSKLRLPIRNRFLWDETSDETVTTNTMDLILNAMINVHGKDLHTADFMVPLNPDMRPSHMVRLNNMGFFDNHVMRLEGVIHMFSSGGVQNGCVTMGVVVDPQGSFDPRKLPAHLQEILRLQNSALDVSALSRDPALDSGDLNIPIDNLVKPINVSKIRQSSYIRYSTELMVLYAHAVLAKELEELIAAYEIFTYQYLCWTLGKPITEFKEPLVDSEKVSAGKFNYKYGVHYTSAVNEVYRKANKLVEKVKAANPPLPKSVAEYFLDANNQPIQKFLLNPEDIQLFNEVMEENRPIIEARNDYDFIPPRMVVWPFDFASSKANETILKILGTFTGPAAAGVALFIRSTATVIYNSILAAIFETGTAALRVVLGGVLGIIILSILGWDAGKFIGGYLDTVTVLFSDYEKALNQAIEIAINNTEPGKGLEDQAETFLYTPTQKELVKYFIYVAERQHVIEMRKNFPILYKQIDPIIVYLNGKIADLKAKIPGLINSEKAGESKFIPSRIPTREEPKLPFGGY